jgi:hypothetical protein
MKIKVIIYLHVNILCFATGEKNLSSLILYSLIGHCPVIVNVNLYHGHAKRFSVQWPKPPAGELNPCPGFNPCVIFASYYIYKKNTACFLLVCDDMLYSPSSMPSHCKYIKLHECYTRLWSFKKM